MSGFSRTVCDALRDQETHPELNRFQRRAEPRVLLRCTRFRKTATVPEQAPYVFAAVQCGSVEIFFNAYSLARRLGRLKPDTTYRLLRPERATKSRPTGSHPTHLKRASRPAHRTPRAGGAGGGGTYSRVRNASGF